MTTELNWQQRGIASQRGVVQSIRLQAASAISPNRALALDSSGKVAHAGADDLDFVGVSPERSYSAAEYLDVAIDGAVPVEVDLPVIAGQYLKCGAAGKLTQLVTNDLDAVTMHSVAAGGNFANQPANDDVTVVSAAAGDTTQTCTIYFTYNGGGDVPTSETKTLNGTNPVTFNNGGGAKPEIVLGIVLSAATAGNLTVKEASGGLTITTITAGQTSAGVEAVAAGTTQQAYNRTISAVAGGASTKQIGFIGTDSTGAALLDSQALNGTTPVVSNQAFRTVTYVLDGDVAAATTVTVKTTATEDDKNLAVARALENQTTAGSTVLVKIL